MTSRSDSMPAADSAENSELSRWFREEIHPYEPRLRAWLRSKFPQISDLDDLVQETYLRLLQVQGVGKWEHPRAYLFTTARNAALDRFRRSKVVTFERIPEPAELPGPADSLADTEASSLDAELSALSEAIRELPERCREVLILRKIHGLSHREIADRLGISPHTVNAQITVAMVKCRAFFQKRGLINRTPA